MTGSRSYRLRRDEPLSDEIARVARGRIDHALDGLRGASGGALEEAVHEARKDMKKLRALLRLVRGELGDRGYRRENACFRDAARELAGARDADVMLETLDGLALPPAVEWDIRKALEAHRRAAAQRVGGQAATTFAAVLTKARGRVDGWELEDDSLDALRPGLKRGYRRARRAMETARREPAIDALHEWRKRAKDARYQQALLGMDALAEESHALTDVLGEHNDLAVLSEWVDRHTSAGPLLGETVRDRRAELLAEALARGVRLYAGKPGAYARDAEIRVP